MVSQIIFTCAAEHSAVNYPQYDYFGSVTNMPAALWADPRLDAQSNAPSFLKLLPMKGLAVSQIDLAFQLSSFQYDKLGDYSPGFTTVAGPAVAAFRQALQNVDTAIVTRNNARRNADAAMNYLYLRPSSVLQSISI
jgi:hypothetical protein